MLDYKNNKYEKIFLSKGYYLDVHVAEGYDFIKLKESKSSESLTNTIPLVLRYPNGSYNIVDKEKLEINSQHVIFAIKH